MKKSVFNSAGQYIGKRTELKQCFCKDCVKAFLAAVENNFQLPADERQDWFDLKEYKGECLDYKNGLCPEKHR
jgi:hypothetical protein